MGPTVTVVARPDVRDLIAVHDVFRRLLRDLPELVAAVRPGDVARAGLLATRARELLAALRHHHEVEDEWLWPPLLRRVPADRGPVLAAEEQHERVHALVGRVANDTAEFARTASSGAQRRLVATLGELRDAACEHMADEEGDVLPLVERYLTVGEWLAFGARARDGVPRLRQFVQLGWVLDGRAPAERRAALARLPLSTRLLWHVRAGRLWRRERDALYAR